MYFLWHVLEHKSWSWPDHDPCSTLSLTSQVMRTFQAEFWMGDEGLIIKGPIFHREICLSLVKLSIFQWDLHILGLEKNSTAEKIYRIKIYQVSLTMLGFSRRKRYIFHGEAQWVIHFRDDGLSSDPQNPHEAKHITHRCSDMKGRDAQKFLALGTTQDPI